MKGVGYLYRLANQDGDPEKTEFTRPPTLDYLKGCVGGYIEAVPLWHLFVPPGESEPVNCVAFCDEEGKLTRKRINVRMTKMWHECLKLLKHQDGRQRFPEGLLRDGQPQDVLVGDIVVITGDPAFMEEL